jgi:hypothetical protein
MRGLLAMLLCAGCLAAEDQAPPPPDEAGHQEPGFQLELLIDEDPQRSPVNRPPPEDSPGQPPAVAPVSPRALIIHWELYRTVVVIGDGIGLRRPAWVATYYRDEAAVASEPGLVAMARRGGFRPERWADQPLIGYRGLAFTDAKGRIHIDARKSVVVGPLAGTRGGPDAWIPDSFMLTPPTRIDAVDDEPSHPANQGVLHETIDPAQAPDRYRALLEAAQQAVVTGI